MMTIAQATWSRTVLQSFSAFIITFLGFAFPANAVDQVPWVADLATAQRIAASRNQLVLLHFTADSCPPCRRIEENVFSDAIFGRSIAEAFVPVKVNVTLNPTLAEQYRIKAWPTDIMLAPDGREIHRMISQQDKNQYLTSLRQVAWAFQSQPAQTSLAAARTGDPTVWPPTQAGTASLASAATPSVGSQPFAPTYDNTMAQTSYGQPSSPYAPNPNQPPQSLANAPTPNASQSAAMSPPVAPLEVDNSYVQGASYAATPVAPSSPASTAGATSTYPPNGGIAPPPSASPPPMTAYTTPSNNTYATPQNNMTMAQGAPNMPPAADPFSTANAQASYAPSAPPTMPVQAPPPDLSSKPALDGFCPVAVLDEDRWAAGDSRWGARHRGRVYLFHDAASQQRFLADPERYSPALAGFDPVLFSEQGQFVEGKREHGLRFENQMFLFQSEASLAKFEKNPDLYNGYVRQAVLGTNVQR
jgi:thiol-disulfide isomerase/thioredoxin/YHS domain-containing protein